MEKVGSKMAIKTRWMDAIKQEAATLGAAMPWERGKRRQEMIARRRMVRPARPLTPLFA